MTRSRVLLGVGLLAFAGVFGAVAFTQGVFLSRDWLFGWLLLLLLALSLSDVKRWVRGVAFDWLPLMAVLLLYDLSHAVSSLLPITPHVYPQLDFDRFLGAGTLPTLAMQHSLYRAGHPGVYDYLAWAVYLSHFFVTLLVAVFLWRFAYPRFRRFRALVVALATAGFVTYVLFPAVPPWLAAHDGRIAPVHRIIAEIWGHTGVHPAVAVFENHDGFYNQVAAIPSLHAAYPLLLLLFFWRDGRWARLGLGLYVLAMAWALVYTGEHYVADVLIGWAYAGGMFAAVTALSHSRASVPRPIPAAFAEEGAAGS